MHHIFIAAFHAQMTTNTSPTPGQTVQFGTETLDIGSGYNPATSVYTAPMAGTYTFTWTIRVSGNNYQTELVVNNSAKDRIISYNNNDVSTGTTVVSLNAGDRVFVRVYTGSVSIYSDINGKSTFSGWMLN